MCADSPVESSGGRTNGTSPPFERHIHDLGIIHGDVDATHQLRTLCSQDRMRDERLASERQEILARQARGASARSDHGDDVHATWKMVEIICIVSMALASVGARFGSPRMALSTSSA
jgi:hypothetical protein